MVSSEEYVEPPWPIRSIICMPLVGTAMLPDGFMTPVTASVVRSVAARIIVRLMIAPFVLSAFVH